MSRQSKVRVCITIICRRKRILDTDNPFTKPIVDALKGRFIEDDSAAIIKTIHVQQEKIKKGEFPSVTVIIDYGEVDGNKGGIYYSTMQEHEEHKPILKKKKKRVNLISGKKLHCRSLTK